MDDYADFADFAAEDYFDDYPGDFDAEQDDWFPEDDDAPEQDWPEDDAERDAFYAEAWLDSYPDWD